MSIFRWDLQKKTQSLGTFPIQNRTWGALALLEASANVRPAIVQAGELLIGARWPELLQIAYAESGIAREGPQLLVANRQADLDDAAISVSTNIRHARSYFEAVGRAPNTVKPTLLYYGCLTLAKAVSDATFGRALKRMNHGLRMDKGNRIEVQSDGEFRRFHDSFCTSPAFYGPSGHDYQMEQVVVSIPGVRTAATQVGARWAPFLNELVIRPDGLGAELADGSGAKAWSYAPALELAAAFALSDWSRYDPIGWETTLRGDKSGDVYVYLTAIDRIEQDFPRWALSCLTGTKYTATSIHIQPDEPDEVGEGHVWIRG
jgi:hypothetical protein